VSSLEWISCPRCGSSRSHTLFEGRDHLHGLPGQFCAAECAECGFQFQNPRPGIDAIPDLYPASYAPHESAGASPRTARSNPFGQLKHRVRHPVRCTLPAFLRDSFGYEHLPDRPGLLAKSQALALRGLCRREAGIGLVPRLVREGRLLEIGCAVGDYLAALRDLGWQALEGIEPVPRAAQQAAARGFVVRCASAEAGLRDRTPQCYDVIVASMVLEHLHDPFAITRAVATILKPGGQFLFSTQVRDGLDRRLFGEYWPGFDFPRHMSYFSRRDIEQLVAPYFDIEAWHHQNAPQDYARGASWRLHEGQLRDRLILFVANSRLAPPIGWLLASLGMTGRVSVRCRRKQA
jgi:SAM-dependent methyltransferase